MLGKVESKRRRGRQRMRWLDSITDSMDMNFRKLQEIEEPGMLQSVGSQRVRHNLLTEQNKQGVKRFVLRTIKSYTDARNES